MICEILKFVYFGDFIEIFWTSLVLHTLTYCQGEDNWYGPEINLILSSPLHTLTCTYLLFFHSIISQSILFAVLLCV